jgi:hypothetical protein
MMGRAVVESSLLFSGESRTMASKATPILGRGPWAQLVGYRDVLCPDGRRRTVRVGVPDSFFSAPGRVQVRGKTVSGFVTSTGVADDDGSYDFKFVPQGKNSSVFGRWCDGRELPEGYDPAEWYWASGLNCYANTKDSRVLDETCGEWREWPDYLSVYEVSRRRA